MMCLSVFVDYQLLEKPCTSWNVERISGSSTNRYWSNQTVAAGERSLQILGRSLIQPIFVSGWLWTIKELCKGERLKRMSNWNVFRCIVNSNLISWIIRKIRASTWEFLSLQDIGVLVWENPQRRLMVVARSGHDDVKRFWKEHLWCAWLYFLLCRKPCRSYWEVMSLSWQLVLGWCWKM